MPEDSILSVAIPEKIVYTVIVSEIGGKDVEDP